MAESVHDQAVPEEQRAAVTRPRSRSAPSPRIATPPVVPIPRPLRVSPPPGSRALVPVGGSRSLVPSASPQPAPQVELSAAMQAHRAQVFRAFRKKLAAVHPDRFADHLKPLMRSRFNALSKQRDLALEALHGQGNASSEPNAVGGSREVPRIMGPEEHDERGAHEDPHEHESDEDVEPNQPEAEDHQQDEEEENQHQEHDQEQDEEEESSSEESSSDEEEDEDPNAQAPAPQPPVVPPPAPVDDTDAKAAWKENAATKTDAAKELSGVISKGASFAGGHGIDDLRDPVGTAKKFPGYWDKKLHPSEPDTDPKHDVLGDATDIVGGAGSLLGGATSIKSSVKKLESGDRYDKTSGGFKLLAGVSKILGGAGKVARGIWGRLSRAGGHKLGAHGAQLSKGIAGTGAAASSLGLAGSIVDAGKSFKEFRADKKAGKFKSTAQGGKKGALKRSVLRGGKIGAGLAMGAAGAVKGISGLIHGGGAVSAVAGAAAGGLSAVLGAGEAISGGHRLYLAHKRSKRLAQVQAAPNSDEAKALAHLKEIQKKRKRRAGASLAYGAAGILAGGLMASGVGAHVGAGIAAGIGAVKLGHLAFRGIRQWGRNKAAKSAANSRWRKVFNAEKSSDKKKARDLATAKTVLAANNAHMLASLGLEHGNAFKKAGANGGLVDMSDKEKLATIVKKLRKR